MAEDGVSAPALVGKAQTARSSTPAVVISCGSDSMRFRPLTPSTEILEQARLKWAQGLIVDHEGFQVTPSSPALNPGLYEYTAILPSGLSSPAQLRRPSPTGTGQDHDAEMLEKAKTDLKRTWQQLWSQPTSRTHKMN